MTALTIDEVKATVRRTVEALAPLPDVPAIDTARLVDDLGYHSLVLLELAFALEEVFGLEALDEATARRIDTVGDLTAQVIAQLEGRVSEEHG